MQKAHGQGKGNPWLLLPMPAIESRPQNPLHHQVVFTKGGGTRLGVTCQTSRKSLTIRSASPGRLVLGLPHHLSEQRGRLFAASQCIRKGPKGAGIHILRGPYHCS